MEIMNDCTLCPRECHVDRASGKLGFCGTDARLMVSRASLHMWEEPCISGKNGSGTVFFSGCSLKCVFCQNEKISRGECGKIIDETRLAEIFIELQSKNANNINLVTPTHFVPNIIEAIKLARKNGLTIPMVYNSGGYEKSETIKMLDGYIDVYLPDFKYMSDTLGLKYSCAKDYAFYAKQSLDEMVNQVGTPSFERRSGLIKKGVIIRHLVLPNHVDDSKNILKYIHEKYGERVYISIMSQYTPLSNVSHIEELNRKLTQEEYDQVVDYAISIGVKKAFIQDGETAKESFIPDFDCSGV